MANSLKDDQDELTVEAAMAFIDTLHKHCDRNPVAAMRAAGMVTMHMVRVAELNEEERGRFFEAMRTFLAGLDAGWEAVEASVEALGEPLTKSVH